MVFLRNICVDTLQKGDTDNNNDNNNNNNNNNQHHQYKNGKYYFIDQYHIRPDK